MWHLSFKPGMLKMRYMPETDMIMMVIVWGLNFLEVHNQVEVAAIGKLLHSISLTWQFKIDF